MLDSSTPTQDLFSEPPYGWLGAMQCLLDLGEASAVKDRDDSTDCKEDARGSAAARSVAGPLPKSARARVVADVRTRAII